MSSPAALDSARTGTPDNSSGIQISTVVAQEGTIEIPGGIALSDRIASGPSAHRSGLSAVDSDTDMSTTDFAGASGADLNNINNRGAVVVWCEFANAAGSATVFLVFYDAADAPLFISPDLNFAASAVRVSAAGDYMSQAQMVDSYGASQYKAFLKAIGTGNVDIFAHPI